MQVKNFTVASTKEKATAKITGASLSGFPCLFF
jgi:hypothetical protein